jgi:flagellin
MFKLLLPELTPSLLEQSNADGSGTIGEEVFMTIRIGESGQLALNALHRSQRHLMNVHGQVSSGLQLQEAADGSSDLTMANRLRHDIRQLSQGRQNAFDGVNMIQVIEGVLVEVSNLLTRAAELSTQAASGTSGINGSMSKQALDQEYQEVLSELQRIQDQTSMNQIDLFGSTILQFSIQFGDSSAEQVTIQSDPVDPLAFGLDGSRLLTTSEASTVLTQAQWALDQVGVRLGNLGKTQSRLRMTLQELDEKIIQTREIESKLRDVDMATAISDLTSAEIRQRSATSALAQANLSPERVLILLR